MYIHEHPSDRRHADLQIRQAFIVTLSCFWTTILVVVWSFTPLTASGVWPLLEIVETSGGRKAPYVEGDIFVSVTRSGDIYLENRKATIREFENACTFAVRRRLDWRGNPYRNEIFIRVDKAAPFGTVRRVITAAQTANVDRVTFLARPAENPLNTIYF